MNFVHAYAHLGELYFAVIGGTITLGAWYHVSFTHEITFSGAFAQANTGGIINIWYGYANFPGGAYGPRFIAYGNSIIASYSGTTAFLPGSSAGSVDASSVYY
jgi:hypothetical protein